MSIPKTPSAGAAVIGTWTIAPGSPWAVVGQAQDGRRSERGCSMREPSDATTTQPMTRHAFLVMVRSSLPWFFHRSPTLGVPIGVTGARPRIRSGIAPSFATALNSIDGARPVPASPSTVTVSTAPLPASGSDPVGRNPMRPALVGVRNAPAGRDPGRLARRRSPPATRRTSGSGRARGFRPHSRSRWSAAGALLRTERDRQAIDRNDGRRRRRTAHDVHAGRAKTLDAGRRNRRELRPVAVREARARLPEPK